MTAKMDKIIRYLANDEYVVLDLVPCNSVVIDKAIKYYEYVYPGDVIDVRCSN